ncbi:porin family protein [Sulfurovum sp. bin170]|uniref:outer membrane beta-barrel protein n=1 Tax=Sulfurovum sp. bin170 TaxID=2695268 RepID=UPI0013DE96CD|nr:outer membrane beta-barrel protein [Sulfurovum sp. bin170]NEW61219.1 porin family protein [Sulfurovum sp. bin170]
MRFSIKTVLILFLFNLTAGADILTDKMYSFIGVQSSYTDYDNESAPTIGFKYGKQTDTWRTAISYNYAQNSDDRYQSLIMQIDAGVLTELFRDIPLKPYLGFSFGVMEHRNSANAPSKDRGYLYGLNAGFNYVINNSFDVDFGCRYMDGDKLEYVGSRGDITLSLHYYFE